METEFDRALDVIDRINKLKPDGFISLSHEFFRYSTSPLRTRIMWSLVDFDLGSERILTGETPEEVFDKWLHETHKTENKPDGQLATDNTPAKAPGSPTDNDTGNDEP